MGGFVAAARQAGGAMPALVACLIVLLSAASALAAVNPLEYAVKATYLYKFAPFVEWPAAAFPSPSSPIHLCVVGDDPFGPLLDRVVRGQRIGVRPIVVRRLRTVRRGSRCHIMYIAGSNVQSVAEALDAARGSTVLTITDAATSAGARGIIHFVIHDNRVRFEIDNRAAARNRIMISSKLLSLALSVRPRASERPRTMIACICPASGS